MNYGSVADLNKAIKRVRKVMKMDFALLPPVERLQLVSEMSSMARKFGVRGEIELDALLARLEELKGKLEA